jgi:hypothetical protein
VTPTLSQQAARSPAQPTNQPIRFPRRVLRKSCCCFVAAGYNVVLCWATCGLWATCALPRFMRPWCGVWAPLALGFAVSLGELRPLLRLAAAQSLLLLLGLVRPALLPLPKLQLTVPAPPLPQ